MFYYNQLDYPNVNYDRPGTSKIETVATSGCGVCTAAMIFNNLAGKELYTVKQMAEFSVKNGARGDNGTIMSVLLDALCRKNKNFSYTTTSDEAKLVSHLKAGGMAAVNQGDSYDVFSSAGHFVVAYKMNGSNIEILDPYMYDGKYSRGKRPDRIVKKTTYGCIVSKSEISKATAGRSPSYYLVTYKKPSDKPTVKAGDKVVFTDTRKCYKGYGSKTGAYKINELTAFGSDDTATRRKNTTATVTAVKTLSSGNVWIEYKINTHKVYSCIYDKKTNKKHIIK